MPKKVEEVASEPLEDQEETPKEEVAEECLEESDDEIIEIKKPKKTPLGKPKKVEKRERTPAQIAAWERCLQKRAEARAARTEIKKNDEKLLAEYKESLKKKQVKKVVKKAEAIKKKAIMVDEDLDEISDDETPIEVVIAKAKQNRAKRATPVKQPVQPPPEPMVPRIIFR
jgi:hypothetical protein